jgi:hypothetical protein
VVVTLGAGGSGEGVHQDSCKDGSQEDRGRDLGYGDSGLEDPMQMPSGGDTPPLTEEVCPICGWNQGGTKVEVEEHIDHCIRKETVFM